MTLSDAPTSNRNRDSLPPAIYRGIWYRPDRPKIVGLIGWLCAAIGYVGFVLKGSQLPAHFMDMKWLNANWVPMPYSRVQFAIAVSLLLAEMAVALLCIAGAMGTLKMREWGRRTLIWYAILGAVLTLLKVAWQISMFDFMLDYQISTTTQPIDRKQIEGPAFFAMIVMTTAMLLWSVIVYSILTRRYVKDAFIAADGGHGVALGSDDWRSNDVSSRRD